MKLFYIMGSIYTTLLLYVLIIIGKGIRNISTIVNYVIMNCTNAIIEYQLEGNQD